MQTAPEVALMDESPTTEDVFGRLDDLDLNLGTPSGFSPVGLDSDSWHAVDDSADLGISITGGG